MFDSGACVIPVGVFAFVKCVCFSRESYIYDSGVLVEEIFLWFLSGELKAHFW